jgi:hypothetical protein
LEEKVSVPIFAVSAATSAAVAAELARKQREEEEEMTPYKSDDLAGWEFKIVRSATGKFNQASVVRKLCEEESRAGWEMLEKFDEYRIRFKRKTEHRGNDHYLEVDPYRTQIGIGPGQLGLMITGAIIGIVLLVLLIVFLLNNS